MTVNERLKQLEELVASLIAGGPARSVTGRRGLS